MSDGVIFGTKAEASLWNEIAKADGVSNPANRDKALATVLNKILSSEEPVESHILCRMIELISEREAEGWQDDVRDLVELRRPRDCRPVLTAASCLTHKGQLTDAENYLDTLGEAPDKAMYHFVRAVSDGGGSCVLTPEKPEIPVPVEWKFVAAFQVR